MCSTFRGKASSRKTFTSSHCFDILHRTHVNTSITSKKEHSVVCSTQGFLIGNACPSVMRRNTSHAS